MYNEKFMPNDTKIIVIGLDGATLDLMIPWMNSGKLPHFDTIRKKGSYGKLRSTTPPYSAPAWVSIATGCQPGKHGIYDFFRTDNISKNLVNSRYRKTPAVWKYLTDMNKKSIVVGVPGTYPPEKINGFMVTGLLTPSPESKYTYPVELKQDLVEGKIGEYVLEQVGLDDIPKNLYAIHAPQKLVDKINYMTVSHATVTLNLMKKNDWDFAMVVFRGTDDAQHLLWDKKDHVLSCYQKADEQIGIIMKAFPDALYIFVSDHGFTTAKKYLYVNNVLYNHGYLKTNSNPNYSMENILMYLFNKLSGLIFRILPMEKLVRTPIGRKLIFSSGTSGKIDFLETKAVYHSICGLGIRILLKEKYKNGIVEIDEYEQLREDLISLFTEIKDSETGEHIVKNVYRYEDVYGKDAVNDPLDLIFEINVGYGTQELLRQPEGAIRTGQKDELSILSRPGFYDWIGDHAPDGIIFMYGNSIKKNNSINASVMDIVPTILAAMNIPIPDIIDGNVINSAFSTKLKCKKINWNKEFSKTKPLTNLEMNAIKRLRKKL